LPLFIAEKQMLCPFPLYQILLSSKIFYSENLKNFTAQKSPPPGDRWGASAQSADEENIVSSKNSQFEANNTAAGIKPPQTFSIILPNLIYKSKKRNLRK